MKKFIILLMVAFCILPGINLFAQQPDVLKDARDGQVYKTIKIGDQWWITENLRFESKSGFTWFEEAPQYRKLFGCYYTFDIAKTVCPAGWHLPSDREWQSLADFLGGVFIAGGKLKSKDTWMPPNTGATNETGFSAMPAGFRDLDGSFAMMGSTGYFWSSNENQTGNGSMWLLGNDMPGIRNADYDKKSGLNVRCIKDTPVTR